MTSSSSLPSDRVLDTSILVYGLLQGHPAQAACEQLLRTYPWLTSPLVLFEAKTILSKVYGVDPVLASQKVALFASGSNITVDLTSSDSVRAIHLADAYAIDITDSILLGIAQGLGATYLATDDQRLAQVCRQLGITPISPLDAALRQTVYTWEAANLAPKGLQRVLRRIHQWLSQYHPQAAQDFWSRTGAGSHLP
jgi:predicted nucleic acid-binding protein